MAVRWAAILGRPSRVADGCQAIDLDDAEIRFVPVTDGRGEGVGGFDVVATDRGRVGTTVGLVGTRVRFV